MPGIVDADVAQSQPQNNDPQYTVIQQEVELDVDFRSRMLAGRAIITVEPQSKSLSSVSLGCRALQVTKVTVDGVQVKVPKYRDPYSGLKIRDEYDVHQHHQIRDNIYDAIQSDPEPNLRIPFPKGFRVRRMTMNEARNGHPNGASDATVADQGEDMFEPIVVTVEYFLRDTRDSLQWVGLREGDSRYPHVYTCASSLPGSLPCFVFPHLDLPTAKYSWKLSIRCPRTLADLYEEFRIAEQPNDAPEGPHKLEDDAMEVDEIATRNPLSALTDEEKSRDLVVVGSGLLEESDAPCENSDHYRTWVFTCLVPVTPAHIGFAIGPFDEVDFSDMRESGKEDQLKDHAVGVHGYCLPGRAEELKNTCLPMQMAIDNFMQSYISYPFAPDCQTYRMCFVDDMAHDVIDTATLSICSSRLLFPETILDNTWETSRILIRAAASQWIGVFITAKENVDYWIIVGGSYFMAENFMAHLWGRNELRFRQKIASDNVKFRDKGMPSIVEAGNAVSLDPAELEFLELKAPLVLYLLHQRLVKLSGAVGVVRILTRMLTDARSDRLKNNEIWTDRFIYTTEKVAHHKVQTFFEQWVKGSGCPSFLISQAFQKKKFSVLITIKQTQKHEQAMAQPVRSDTFMREVKEAENDIYAPPLQESFIGPMTIRVHEPSGLPYEQIVEIRDVETKVEFHYNSKNKNQLRKRRQRQREAAASGHAVVAEDGDDYVPTYSLGDVLTSAADMAEWRLVNYSADQDVTLENASYEWLRVDKDFEWIANVTFQATTNPGELELMYIQQLQGDNDVVAHLEAIDRLQAINPSHLLSTVYVRTLMDSRYFYGVRVKAAEALASCATANLQYVGLFHLQKAFQTLFCFQDSPMTTPNDFSDLRVYHIRCAIVRSMATIRDHTGKAPAEVKRFFLDKLKFNDNTSNEFSDSFYVGYLIGGLTHTLTSSYNGLNLSFDTDVLAETAEEQLKHEALNEIERMRRIDEWIPSYRNIHTRAALRGLIDLMTWKVIPPRVVSFLPYTRAGNFDEVRLEAFDHLIKLNMMANDSFLRYLFTSLSSDPSAYFRDRLWRRIKRGLALIALGETKIKAQKAIVENAHELAIDEGETLADRSEAAERSTIEGAMKWLRSQLQDNVALQDAIMEAFRSPVIGLRDFSELLDICNYLYTTSDKLLLKLQYPRYWAVRHQGKAKLKFYRTQKPRFKPMPRILKRKQDVEENAGSTEAKRPKITIAVSRDKIIPLTPHNPLPSPGPTQPVTQTIVIKPPPKIPIPLAADEKPNPKPKPKPKSKPLPAPVLATPLAEQRQPAPIPIKVSSSSTSKKPSPSTGRATPTRPTNKGKSKILKLKFVRKKSDFAAWAKSVDKLKPLSQTMKVPKVRTSPHTNGHRPVVKPETAAEPPLASIPAPSKGVQKSADNSAPPKLKLKIKLGGGGGK